MNAPVIALEAPAETQEQTAAGVTVAAVPALAAALVALAIQSLLLPLDADVSWLITVCERVLAGERLYVDIYEVNPPASVWLYLAFVWLAQLTGARPEAVVAAAFLGAGLASVLVTVRLAARLESVPSAQWLAAVLGFILLVLPAGLFAQREHAALLLAFPALAALAIVVDDKPIGGSALRAGGLAAGLIVILKPFFLLAIVGPALWAAARRGSLRPLGPAIAAALAAIAFYAAAVFLFARAYFDWLPVLTLTYGSIHEQWWKLALGPALYPAVCLGLALILRSKRASSLSVVWALGSAGFVLAAWAQAKNYPNHWLPAAALALAAASAMLSLPRIGRWHRASVAVALLFVAGCELYQWWIRPDAGSAAQIRRVAPPAAKIIALSPELTTGHPVTRNTGGAWAGARAALFTAAGARHAGLGDSRALQAYREDLAAFARDVAKNEPDVVLVHKPTKRWLMGEPVIATAMREYRFEAASAHTEVWVRRRPQR